MGFKPGQVVEVILNEEGFQACYYEVEILKHNEEDDTYNVEYKTLLDDNDPTTFVTDVVPGDHLRPVPPEVKHNAAHSFGFFVGDQVDVRANSGWWKGTVVAVKGPTCIVFFPESTTEVISYPVRKLRFHLDWKNGYWALPRRPVQMDC